MIYYYKGSEVTIKVQEKDYKLAKLLACHSSTMFNAAFNGTFKEGKEQKMTLDTSTGVLKIAIKWMFTGTVGPKPKTMKQSDYLAQLLEFLTLSDFLGLLGPLTPVTAEISSILKSRGNLVSDHIKHAMKQSPGSEARTILLRACVRPYLQSLGWTCVNNMPGVISNFRFRTEMKELDGFAGELFRLYDGTIRKKQRVTHGQIMVKDPLTGDSMFWECFGCRIHSGATQRISKLMRRSRLVT